MYNSSRVLKNETRRHLFLGGRDTVFPFLIRTARGLGNKQQGTFLAPVKRWFSLSVTDTRRVCVHTTAGGGEKYVKKNRTQQRTAPVDVTQ